jgi:4-diphosphocytidyl-2-C-methyl-D-erythritol kinase
MNEMFDARLPEEELIKYAAEIGSDCPFFIRNRPCLVTGRGERIEPVPLSLAGYHLVLVFPGISIDTGTAYARIRPDKGRGSLREILDAGPGEWKGRVINRFEKALFREYPEIRQIRESLYGCGALYASMTGSGSAVYGIFGSPPRLGSNLGDYRIHMEELV